MEEWNKKDKELMLIKKIILKYYIIDKEKGDNFFYKIKPEIILFKIFKRLENKSIYKFIKNDIYNNDLSWYSSFVIDFYKFLGIKCLDIMYLSKLDLVIYNFHKHYDFYEDKYIKIDENIKIENQKLIDDIPDIIVLSKREMLRLSKKEINLLTNKSSKIIINGEYLNLNGINYQLDSMIINNYTHSHFIAGITYKLKKYIYNSLDYNKDNIIKSACPLIEYNWSNYEDYDNNIFYYENCILNSNKIDIVAKDYEDKDLFSININNNNLLIFVRVDKSNLSISKSTKDISLSSNEFQRDIENLLKDIYNIDEIITKKDVINKMKYFSLKYDINKTLEENKTILYKTIIDLYI